MIRGCNVGAIKIQIVLNEIERKMSKLAPHRSFALFEHFLIKGYSALTLDSVPKSHFSNLLYAKLCIGTFITLLDDFADRPEQADSVLLDQLYRFRFNKRPSSLMTKSPQLEVFHFAHSLLFQIESVLKSLPNYARFIEILNFDLLQFYSANQYSSLLTSYPDLNNRLENRMYAHHNMGMIMVAMIDLMALGNVEVSELGSMREVFLIGQRMGRIFNVFATRDRQVLDNDITGELSTCKNQQDLTVAERALRLEVLHLYRRLESFDGRITSFSTETYTQGLRNLQSPYEQMQGTI